MSKTASDTAGSTDMAGYNFLKMDFPVPKLQLAFKT